MFHGVSHATRSAGDDSVCEETITDNNNGIRGGLVALDGNDGLFHEFLRDVLQNQPSLAAARAFTNEHMSEVDGLGGVSGGQLLPNAEGLRNKHGGVSQGSPFAALSPRRRRPAWQTQDWQLDSRSFT